MPLKQVMSFKGGVNMRLPAWHKDMETKKQCVLMQNLRYKDEYVDSIPGSKKFHGTSMGSSPVTAIMQYHNDQTDEFKLLAACGGSIYKRNPETNEFSELLGALTPNSVFGSDQRYEVLYIPSVKDGLKKYLGGEKIEKVGTGATAPGNFRQVLYMKEIDRMFGISDDAIYGQISWCELGDPETWDGASVQRFKLKKGERVEGGAILYGKLIVFCTYSIWIYYVQGNEENWRLEEAPTTVGCPAPSTIKKVGSEIWFLGDAPEYDLGVYKFNGTISTLLTDDVSPFFVNANKEKLRNACAEVHDNLYTISFAYGFSETNDVSLDLDIVNAKEDGAPAIYGPHTFGFYSSCVLNNRQNSKQFLMGSETDGFIYAQGGTTFKGVNGDDGSLIAQRFISRIHNEEKLDVMKRYNGIDVYFRPRGFFKAQLKTYLAYQGFANVYDFRPAADYVGFAGEFDVFEKTLQGTPDLYTFHAFPEKDHCRGTAIQIEICNYALNGQIAFDGFSYDYSELHTTRKVQSL
jgi:hypothetical protein